MRTRKVGTMTLGIILILFGVLFLLRWFLSFLDFNFILRLWPLVLIFLGFEILIFELQNKNKETKIIYDGYAILLIFILSIFAIGMAVTELLMDHDYTFIVSI